MYAMSKEYIRKYVQIEGPLLMEPEDLMLAVKKETLTRTSDLVKATAMKGLKELFPTDVNPFAGGFGNRENDSIAYHFAGMQLQDIYQVDILGRVHQMSNGKKLYTYGTIHQNIEDHFPRLIQPRVRLYPSV